MAINAYVGLQGSGKSFEVVSSPILDAISQGRRVVTNVAGINEDLIHEYLVNKRDVEIDRLGKVIHVENDRIMQPHFFPDEQMPEVDSVVKGGDLVAIDEAWRFWGTDNGKLSHEHMQFFRMHRHYTHPDTAVACDVVLMTQDISGLHRSVKNVIEFAFRMHKHKSLGLTKRYRVEIYEGWKLNSKTRIDDRQKKYDPEIFPLYQSYAGGKGMEKSIDSRQNILANKTLWYYAGGVLVCILIGGYSTWKFFHPKETEVAHEQATSNSPESKAQIATTNLSNALQRTDGAFSENWRIVGQIVGGNGKWIVVANRFGRLRVESPSMFNGSGATEIGEIDKERVTRWTGFSERVEQTPTAQVSK